MLWAIIGTISGSLLVIGGFFEALEPGFYRDAWIALTGRGPTDTPL